MGRVNAIAMAGVVAGFAWAAALIFGWVEGARVTVLILDLCLVYLLVRLLWKGDRY